MRARWIRTELLPILVAVFVFAAARSSLADHYYVPSGSMEPTLVAGDRVAVDKTAYGVRIPFTKVDVIDRARPGRGDVVVFDSPASGTLLIKRVVAVGGDVVSLDRGRLTVNGASLADPAGEDAERFHDKVVRLNLADGGGPGIRGLTIPDGQLLVLGDHRGNSFDGRFFGLVAEREIYGRALAVFYRSGDGVGWRRL
ncbi:MAG: signal peptidase I [Acidobacteria bacterium]|nr:signal peptidase I [Acidobacteriota bacterium]